MILSQTAEYALRAMAFLAAREAGSPATSREVAMGTRIPEPYAAKVLAKLTAAGLLSGRKGHGGGFVLRRPAERISLLEVLEAVEEQLVDSGCAFGRERCNARKPCPLHGVITELKDAVSHWARGTTVASLLEHPELLASHVSAGT